MYRYADELCRKFIVDQVQYYPNSIRVIDNRIITEMNLLIDVIVHYQLPIYDMPPSCQTELNQSKEEYVQKLITTMKENLLDAARKELSQLLSTCAVPPKEGFMSSTRSKTIS